MSIRPTAGGAGGGSEGETEMTTILSMKHFMTIMLLLNTCSIIILLLAFHNITERNKILTDQLRAEHAKVLMLQNNNTQ